MNNTAQYRIRINSSGQALVETVFVLVFIFGLFFSLVQLFLLSVSRIVAFDAAQASARSAVVSKNPQISAMFVFSSQQLYSQVFPEPVRIKRSGCGETGIVTAEIRYFQKVVFPSFFNFLKSPYMPATASCRMAVSPEPEFFNKSWPEAAND